jgi:hypothetical protein
MIVAIAKEVFGQQRLCDYAKTRFLNASDVAEEREKEEWSFPVEKKKRDFQVQI